MRTWFLKGRAGRLPSVLPRRPLALEALEDRCLMTAVAANVLQTNLVSDLPGVAAVQDPNLVNPWGISESPGSPFWISDNNAGVSSLYSVPGANNTPVSINSLVVSIPAPGSPLSASGTPTGTVFNIDGGPSGGFQVSGVSAQTGAAASASAVFLFATEDGTIVGWNPGINPVNSDPGKSGTYGIIAVDNSTNATPAVYKGLTIASGSPIAGSTPQAFNPIFSSDPNSTFVLYASNFRSGKVEVYDTAFKSVALPTGAFTDPNLPKGYAPFNVQVLGSKVYVTYALQDAAKHDDVAGPGHGFVDVYNLDGSPGLSNHMVRLASRGPLDSPWGLALAPSSFTSIAGDLLVGNFGNGQINAFDPASGKFITTLDDPDGEPIQIDGLWGLKVGNGKAGGDANTVYFTAGLFGETHGLFGSLGVVAPGSPEGAAEGQFLVALQDVVQIDLTQLLNDLAASASRSVIRQDIQNLNAAVRQFVDAEHDFLHDRHEDNEPAPMTKARHKIFAARDARH